MALIPQEDLVSDFFSMSSDFFLYFKQFLSMSIDFLSMTSDFFFMLSDFFSISNDFLSMSFHADIFTTWLPKPFSRFFKFFQIFFVYLFLTPPQLNILLCAPLFKNLT